MTAIATPRKIAAYGLVRPSASDARASLQRVYGSSAEGLWKDLLDDAGLRDDRAMGNTDVAKLVDAFIRHDDRLVSMCGRSLQVRLRSFDHLSATYDTIVSAS